MSFWNPAPLIDPEVPRPPVKVSVRTFREHLEESLMASYTKEKLLLVLPEELGLVWGLCDPPSEAITKREIVDGYIHNWNLEQLAAFARRLVRDEEVSDSWRDELRRLLEAYEARGSGVGTPPKNLIFAANGPKPQIVLRDAVNNDIEIVANSQFCLVYDLPVPVEGLRYSHLIGWWRQQQNAPDSADDRTVGMHLHHRLRDSLDSDAERLVFDTYASRYAERFDVPALVPQVYLHYDPYTQRERSTQQNGSPLPRQRMDFLLLFSDRKRVVIEVDGKHHYAQGDEASPKLYSEMVAEDRRLRLTGYEVYRFGGHELTQDPGAAKKVGAFFDQLADKMK